MADNKNNKRIRICLLGASFNTRNMGVNALTIGVIKCILSSFRNVEIVLLDYGPIASQYKLYLSGKNIVVKMINIRFSKKFYLKNNIAYLITLSLLMRAIPLKIIKRTMSTHNTYIREIMNFDIAASIAGGDSFSDIYGLKRFLYVSLPQILILLLQKELILLPQTYGPYKRTMVRVIARYIFNHSHIIYSRDYAGLEYVKKFIKKKMDMERRKFCYDVGFVLDPIKPKRMDLSGLNKNVKEHMIVGLNISGLLFMGGYTRDNMFGLRLDYKELIYSIIDYMINKKDAVVLLIPHVFGYLENPESDDRVCDEVFHELGDTYSHRLFLAKGDYDQSEVKYIIGTCNFFIGSRMHACIAALSQNIPTVAIAYSKKFLGVMETLEIPDIVADIRELQKDEVISIIDDIYNNQAIIKQKLHIKMIEVKNVIDELFHINTNTHR